MTLFPTYVCQQQPQATSWAAFEGDRMVGAVVGGRAVAIYAVPSYWLFADGTKAALALARRLRDELAPAEVELNYPLALDDGMREAFPAGRASIDVYYGLSRRDFRPQPLRHRVSSSMNARCEQWLSPRSSTASSAPSTSFTRDRLLRAFVRRSRARARRVHRPERRSRTIQQLYTLRAERGKGLIGELASHICQLLIARGKLCTYLVSEDNHASIRVAEKLGFRIHSRFGYLEVPRSDSR